MSGRGPDEQRWAMGRGARYGLGFAISGFLALAGLVCVLVAGVMAFGSVVEDDFRQDAVGRTGAVVTEADDVDVWVRFRAEGETYETWVEWPEEEMSPEVGDTVEIAYDPDYPDDGVYLASDVDSYVPSDGRDNEEVSDDAAVLGLVGAGVVGAGLVGAVATPFWARRVPPRPRPAAPWPTQPYQGYSPYQPSPPGYGYPPPGYQPPQYPPPPAAQAAPAPRPEEPRPPEPPSSPWNLPG